MSTTSDHIPGFVISEMTVDDVQPANDVRLQSWLDTYVNDEAGISREWIENRNINQNSPERKERRMKELTDPGHAAWVAKDKTGNIIGLTTPYIDENGIQHVGRLYVNKAWHGKGVGSSLMQKVIDWSDPTKPIELEVAIYNERAKAFYQKWGFKEIRDSETLFADKIPQVKMIRKGDRQ
jgi:ribosomal protein S18 acetylase RimI-like enzyme